VIFYISFPILLFFLTDEGGNIIDLMTWSRFGE
jgi:hypothetical protein